MSTGPDLPVELCSHSAVSFGYNLVIMGGIGGRDNLLQSSIYQLNCENAHCQWTTMKESLGVGKSSFVATMVPDEITECEVGKN